MKQHTKAARFLLLGLVACSPADAQQDSGSTRGTGASRYSTQRKASAATPTTAAPTTVASTTTAAAQMGTVAPQLPVAPLSPTAARPVNVGSQTLLKIVATRKGYVAYRGDDDRLALLDAAFATTPLRPARGPLRLLTDGSRVWMASKAGLERVVPGKAGKPLRAGNLTQAVLAVPYIYWAECPEAQPCTIGRTDLRANTSELITKTRFDIVNDLAVGKDAVWVAGRHRDQREGRPETLSTEEKHAAAQWLLAAGGNELPRGAIYPPGFLARIDAQGNATFTAFPTQRPVAVEADGDSVLVLTEGTPRNMFSDGVLFRIEPDRSWTPLATNLPMPEKLVANPQRICWTAMPARRFEIACWNRASKSAQTLVSEEWNVLDYLDEGPTLVYSVLTKGTFRLQLE